MNASTTASPRIVAVLPRDKVATTLQTLLEEEGLATSVVEPGEGVEAVFEETEALAWLVDDSIEPDTLARAVRAGHISAVVPVFVIARRLPSRERYAEWLDAGAWDILKVPLEAVALALRLRSILAGHSREQPPFLGTPSYSGESLAVVADETLSLSRRYDRPLYCLAVEAMLEKGYELGAEPFIRRLADAVRRLTRRSDLIGIADARTLMILLPDTDEAGLQVFEQRVQEAINDALRQWGVKASVRMNALSAAAAGTENGPEFLDLATLALRPTPL